MTTELKLSISRFLTRSSYTLLMLTLAVHLWLQSAPWIIYVISLLPLALFIPGMLADKLRTLIWMGFVVLLYFYNGVQNLSVAEPATLDIVELVLSVVLFCAAMVYARIRQVNNL
ncbi:DUF2069 domain-containing protein [Porticoccaceae bacterium]|nr:DUF2069 domain-containing protein [Porticoccaceae bacterium]MDA9352572.1 DUF2069 domain-containing protein [Porticoccaceae bacterium]MDB4076375.1 DUF2069 domain-containing protein [Porticoccaceae bacterium]MDB9814631.1 DUF2069 domain-containing protein [bacterium]MDB9953139.1 DUF2069 domain-containing protein [Porticoccaceae bacterium]